MASNQKKKGRLPRMLTTWGEGGISYPNEDDASIPTATKPSRGRLAFIIKGAGEAVCTQPPQQASSSMVNQSDPFSPQLAPSPKPRPGETPLITTNHCSVPLVLAPEPPSTYTPKLATTHHAPLPETQCVKASPAFLQSLAQIF